MPKMEVKPGQRFQSSVGGVWEVQRITNLKNVPKHVVIVDVNNSSDKKIISESALLERHLFQPAQ